MIWSRPFSIPGTQNSARAGRRRLSICLLILSSSFALQAADHKPASDLWVLHPVIRPDVPAGVTESKNPIDSFVAAEWKAKGLTPAASTDKRTLLRRVYLDLIGIPPSPEEQDTFLADNSPDAYEKVVDRLLANEQYAVRYARHWLDVLRYADTDEREVASPGIYLWRDWLIKALHEDVPYDQFVRAQLTGYRTTTRTKMVAVGFRVKVEPRPDDMFALGFLSRSAEGKSSKDNQDLAINSVETVATAFMGLTVGCAKCHDHMYDPIKQRDYYAMKALFDPLVPRKVTLATATDVFNAGKAMEAEEKRRAAIEGPMERLIAPYKKKLYDERLAMLPADIQALYAKPEKDRTADEQKIVDDYYPIVRIDSEKIEEVMPEAEKKQYKEFLKQLDSKKNGKSRDANLPAFWTVEVDPVKLLQTNYILNSGNPDRPEKNHPVEPGWPFAPAKIDFRDGRVEAFSDWLTAPDNPLFARVAVNRLWQWHFGEGLEKTASDFGSLGGEPSNPKLLDWLASEFVKRNFSMREMHKLMVMSETYKLASEVGPELAAANMKLDSTDTFLWHFRLQRLEAEPIWDSIFTAAGDLDPAIGGPSFEVSNRRMKPKQDNPEDEEAPLLGPGNHRRAAYITRGFSPNRDVMAAFLQAFDVDDGRAPCPLRTSTVTAPQSLFLMNSAEIDKASAQFAERVEKQAHGNLTNAINLAYEFAVARPPSFSERAQALTYLDNDPARFKKFTWLLFNLDEFIYAR